MRAAPRDEAAKGTNAKADKPEGLNKNLENNNAELIFLVKVKYLIYTGLGNWFGNSVIKINISSTAVNFFIITKNCRKSLLLCNKMI